MRWRHIGDHRVADEGLDRQFVNLLAALDEVLGRIDVAAGVQPHVRAAHDLAGAAVVVKSLMTSTSNCMSRLKPS